jgi:diguanylate cyclase (GGDEF)-like protein
MSDPHGNAPPPLILIANEEEWVARSLESILGPSGYAVVRVHTGREAIDLATRTRPDAILIDAGLSDIGGIETCRLMRARPGVGDSTPIIMTTASPASRAQRLEAFRAGAWEFCAQPFDTDALILQIERFIAAKRELDRCEDHSLIDEDGVYNVRGLTRRAQELGAEAARRHAPLACLAVSLASDTYTDTDRDAAADIAQHVSETFRRTARGSDILGRLGRSEFVIVAPNTPPEGMLRLADRVRESIVGAATVPPSSVSIRAGYSGVADFAESAVDASELVMRAVTALRTVKPNDDSWITAFEAPPARSFC